LIVMLPPIHQSAVREFFATASAVRPKNDDLAAMSLDTTFSPAPS
jgi:hypothetical protein